MNQPKVFTARAAELSGFASLPLSISFPPADLRREITWSAGMPGRKLISSRDTGTGRSGRAEGNRFVHSGERCITRFDQFCSV
jgi:hypothetical protein